MLWPLLKFISFTNPLKSKKYTILTVITILAWAALVIFTTTTHEYWRDEIRALSYAQDAKSFLQLIKNLENDGHPLLWHLLLFIGDSLTSSPLILPILSFLLAFSAIVLLMLKAPFPFWYKTFFIFSSLPLYTYVVFARNYGISMLLMFSFAVLYSKRKEYPIVLAAVLALLCNTNIHSLLLACLLMSIWLWDSFLIEKIDWKSIYARQIYIGSGIFVSGIAFALFVIWPTENITASEISTYSLSAFSDAFINTLSNPARAFQDVLWPYTLQPIEEKVRYLWWRLPELIQNALLVSIILGLIVEPRLFFVAVVAMFGLSVFSKVIYWLHFRHQGLYIIFLMTLYWISSNYTKKENKPIASFYLFRLAKYAAFPVLFIILIAHGVNQVITDIKRPMSSNASLAQFLDTKQEYRNAIVVGEPDFFLESLPYYTNNPLYFVREDRYGKTVLLTRKAKEFLSLRELLCSAISIQKSEGKPTLIALGHFELENIAEQKISYSYNARTFTWTSEELNTFKQMTQLLATFDKSVMGENYKLYRIKQTIDANQAGCQGVHSH